MFDISKCLGGGGGGGALKDKGLNQAGGGLGYSPEFFFLICLGECISSHFEAHFPYSITSILSKLDTQATSFAFPCRPLGALISFPCGDGGGGAQHNTVYYCNA